jgi:hypothetical protein
MVRLGCGVGSSAWGLVCVVDFLLDSQLCFCLNDYGTPTLNSENQNIALEPSSVKWIDFEAHKSALWTLMGPLLRGGERFFQVNHRVNEVKNENSQKNFRLAMEEIQPYN